jgi:hypothetical protein
LEKYAKNLVEQARSGKLDPVIGRDEEIRRVLQILSRRNDRIRIRSDCLFLDFSQLSFKYPLNNAIL